MTKKAPGETQKPGVSKVKLAIGAASLFLFIVGVKRTFRMDDAEEKGRVTEEFPPDRPSRPPRSL